MVWLPLVLINYVISRRTEDWAMTCKGSKGVDALAGLFAASFWQVPKHTRRTRTLSGEWLETATLDPEGTTCRRSGLGTSFAAYARCLG
jgi:hypothetical protein